MFYLDQQPEAQANVAKLLEAQFTLQKQLPLDADKISMTHLHWCRIYGAR